MKMNKIPDKSVSRKRTPSNMIRPNVHATLKAMLDEGILLSRREIASRAQVSVQTLYSKAIDLVEEAEEQWFSTNNRVKKIDKRREQRALNEEIKILNKRIDEIIETMENMLKAVHTYAPNALPQITKILSDQINKNK